MALALNGCAKTGPPSGGPVDRTPPRVVAHHPASDATGVPLDAQVELLFSEPMDEQATCGAVFVAPASGLKVRCRGRRLQLLMHLRPDRTYVVTVGTDARDRRGNRLEQSYTLAFATGQQLDRGQIAGTVYRKDAPEAGAYVWAYDLVYAGAVGKAPPQYRTQTGKDGAYTFARLAAGGYRVMAFVDENRDRKPDADEWLALPAGDLRVSRGDTVRAGDLLLTAPGAQTVRLQRVRALDRRRLLLEFSAPVRAADVDLELNGLAVEELYGAPANPLRVYARTAEQESGRRYGVSHLAVGGRPVDWQDPVRGSGREDRTPPRVALQLPRGEIMDARDTLALVFDEAMLERVPDDLWVTADSSAHPPVGHWAWHGSLELRFISERPLPPGRLVWRLRLRGLADLAGLTPADSMVEIRHTVVPRADLVEVRGRVQADADTVWVTAQSQTRTYRVRADRTGGFVLGGMLPGVYTLHAFADLDADGQRSPGRLEPFRYAEPYCRWPQPANLAAGDRAAVGTGVCR